MGEGDALATHRRLSSRCETVCRHEKFHFELCDEDDFDEDELLLACSSYDRDDREDCDEEEAVSPIAASPQTPSSSAVSRFARSPGARGFEEEEDFSTTAQEARARARPRWPTVSRDARCVTACFQHKDKDATSAPVQLSDTVEPFRWSDADAPSSYYGAANWSRGEGWVGDTASQDVGI